MLGEMFQHGDLDGHVRVQLEAEGKVAPRKELKKKKEEEEEEGAQEGERYGSGGSEDGGEQDVARLASLLSSLQNQQQLFQQLREGAESAGLKAGEFLPGRISPRSGSVSMAPQHSTAGTSSQRGAESGSEEWLGEGEAGEGEGEGYDDRPVYGEYGDEVDRRRRSALLGKIRIASDNLERLSSQLKAVDLGFTDSEIGASLGDRGEEATVAAQWGQRQQGDLSVGADEPGGSVAALEEHLLRSKIDLQNLKQAVIYRNTLPAASQQQYFDYFLQQFGQPQSAAQAFRSSVASFAPEGPRRSGKPSGAPQPPLTSVPRHLQRLAVDATSVVARDGSRISDYSGPGSFAGESSELAYSNFNGVAGGDQSEAGSSDPFTSMKDTIYQEVAVFISKNEHNPEYLVALFRLLQQFRTPSSLAAVLEVLDVLAGNEVAAEGVASSLFTERPTSSSSRGRGRDSDPSEL